MMSTRRTLFTLGALLVGFGLFAGPAAAQVTFYEYDNAAAWWEYFDCDEMKVIIPRAPDESAGDHEDRACSPTLRGLKRPEMRAIEDFVDSLANGPFRSNEAFWDGNADCLVRVRIVGEAGLVVPEVTMTDADITASDRADALYCENYDDLESRERGDVNEIANALGGEDAPALPLVGVGLLGLLLAGRGAWLRRRNG